MAILITSLVIETIEQSFFKHKTSYVTVYNCKVQITEIFFLMLARNLLQSQGTND